MEIKYRKATNSKLESIDFENLEFGKTCSDHMFVMEYSDDRWHSPEIRPLTYFRTHPANLAWHYGQAIFEGMKAFKQADGTPVLFRVEEHAKRMNESAVRMCMPEIPVEDFVQAVRELVNQEKDWIPPRVGSALYIRPLMMATEEFIGVRPSAKYRFVIFTCPVGPYYDKPVSLRAEKNYVRATPGGVGDAKTAGNYAAALYPAQKALEAGYDQVMWMDPFEFKFIHEVGTMNIFFVINGKIYTPPLDGCILKGITRDSVITLLKAKGLKVVEKPISIQKVYNAHAQGKLEEVFGTGTAAVVSMVKKIGWGKKIIKLKPKTFKIAPNLKDTINKIRSGEKKDKYGWISTL